MPSGPGSDPAARGRNPAGAAARDRHGDATDHERGAEQPRPREVLGRNALLVEPVRHGEDRERGHRAEREDHGREARVDVAQAFREGEEVPPVAGSMATA